MTPPDMGTDPDMGGTALMAGMGPAPKDPSRRARRNAPTINTTVLPAEGRKGSAPKWPFPVDPREAAEIQLRRSRLRALRKELAGADEGGAERRRLAKEVDGLDLEIRIRVNTMRVRRQQQQVLWRQLWKSPQAVMWERLCAERSVAMYVQAQIAGELGNEKQAKEARMRETDLGLNPKGMQNLRWSVAAPEESSKPARRATSEHPRATAGARGRRGAFLQAVPDLDAEAVGDD